MPIGMHEAGREKIAFVAATTFAMEAMTWLTSSWVDKGGVDIRIEAAMAKMFCTESLWKIVDQTMQLRGGRGYEKASSLKARGEVGYPVERMMRDCRINTILEGSTEIMKLFLAREAMDPHLKLAGSLLKKNTGWKEKMKAFGRVMAFYFKWYPAQLLKGIRGKSFSEWEKLSSYHAFIDKTSHRLARLIFFYMAKHRQGLEKRQLILGRLMEVGTDLFAMTAACSYALSLQKFSNDASAVKLADFFCKLAIERIEHNFQSLTQNHDRFSNDVAKDVLNEQYVWLEQGVIPLE
jgi:hypothetical protein